MASEREAEVYLQLPDTLGFVTHFRGIGRLFDSTILLWQRQINALAQVHRASLNRMNIFSALV